MKTKDNIRKRYLTIRRENPDGLGLVGRTAEMALRRARISLLWDKLESAGLVNLEAQPEEESYFGVWGKEEGYERRGHMISSEEATKEIEELLEAKGCYCVIGQYRLPGEDWEHADSVGMCAGYDDPLDPDENWYVTDIQEATIEALRKALKNRCPCCRRVRHES